MSVSRFEQRPVTVIAIIAALIYNVWPLGYIMNPSVARVGLASDLEADGQPYNWFFIGCDVLFGLLTILAVWQLAKNGRRSRNFSLALISLVAFGILTAVSALIPLNCQTDIKTCGYATGQPLGWHDVAGAIAALGLFAAMAAGAGRAAGRLKPALWLITLAWSLSGLWFLYVSVVNDHFWASAIVPSQQIFLVLSGIGLVLAVSAREQPNG